LHRPPFLFPRGALSSPWFVVRRSARALLLFRGRDRSASFFFFTFSRPVGFAYCASMRSTSSSRMRTCDGFVSFSFLPLTGSQFFSVVRFLVFLLVFIKRAAVPPLTCVANLIGSRVFPRSLGELPLLDLDPGSCCFVYIAAFFLISFSIAAHCMVLDRPFYLVRRTVVFRETCVSARAFLSFL